ncbi:MAG: guanylate kinase [Pilosibacter sp.]|nr:guanylate kinase [butyrate-producing bacterium]CBL41656.1 Guanylate kinase [butyrate-producing bacterium SS3/4]
MGRIYYLLGKSATGKDTLYKEILKRRPKLRTVTMYTTRPIREGETDGVEYFFTGREELERQLASGKVIESRTYQTIAGPWTYYTVDDGQFNVADDESCLMIGTLESYDKMCAYFEAGKMVPVYIEVPDGIRLLRAVKREENQKKPNYREVCRRYLADEKDFSEENLERLGITKRYQNTDMEMCVEEILRDLDK